DDVEAQAELVRQARERGSIPTGTPVLPEKSRAACSLLATLLNLGAAVEDVRSKVEVLWLEIHTNWKEYRAHLEMNPHLMSVWTEFLIQLVARRAVADQKDVRACLLDLIRLNAFAMQQIAEILSSEHWEEDWSAVVREIQQAAGGHRGSDSMSWLRS